MISLSDFQIIKYIKNVLDGDTIQLIKLDNANKYIVIANQDKIYLFDY